MPNRGIVPFLSLLKHAFLESFTRLFPLLKRIAAPVVLIAVMPLCVRAQSAVFKTPAVKIPVDVKGQPVSITASAVLTITSSQNQKILDLELRGDLSDLQQNLTPILSSEMNKDDHCGERLTIQNATLSPSIPPALPPYPCITSAGDA